MANYLSPRSTRKYSDTHLTLMTIRKTEIETCEKFDVGINNVPVIFLFRKGHYYKYHYPTHTLDDFIKFADNYHLAEH